MQISLNSEQAKRLSDFLVSLQQDPSKAEAEEQPPCSQLKLDFFRKITLDYSCCKAKQMSKEERSNLHLTSMSFSYGEIPFDSVSKIFHILKTKHNQHLAPGGVFYDLGSGIGKGVIAASLMHPFEKCVGIEYLESLHNSSVDLLRQYDEHKHILQEDALPEIQFVKGDLAKIDWKDGTFIYTSSTCYDPYLMECMQKKALMLPKGTFFITLTKTLKPALEWEILDSFKVPTSWGVATLYIQLKRYDSTPQR